MEHCVNECGEKEIGMRTKAILILLIAGVAWGRGLASMHDSLPPSVKWYLEQR